MSRDTWVQREAEYLVRQYEWLGWISPQQSELLLHLVEDGQEAVALHVIREVAATTRTL